MTQRDRLMLSVVLVVVALAGFWFLLLGPKRKDASRLSDEVSVQQQRLTTAQASVQQSQAARTTYAANYTAVARLGKAVPADDDVPSLVYQLDSTASATGVDFRSIKVSASGAGAAAPATAAAAPSGTGSSGAQTSGSGGGAGQTSTTATTPAPASGATSATPASTATPAAPTQAATATLPPGASVGPAGLAAMPFTFSFQGSFFRLADFFGQLERFIAVKRNTVNVSGRLLQINGISLTSAAEGFPQMQASVAATTYLLPASQGATNGATPSGPGQPVSTNSSTPATPAGATAAPAVAQ